jgi:pilus assembly protein Flp/PilA
VYTVGAARFPLSSQGNAERRFDVLFLAAEEGQGLMEYGLILVLIAIVVFVVLALLGPEIGDLFSTAVDELPF